MYCADSELCKINEMLAKICRVEIDMVVACIEWYAHSFPGTFCVGVVLRATTPKQSQSAQAKQSSGVRFVLLFLMDERMQTDPD